MIVQAYDDLIEIDMFRRAHFNKHVAAAHVIGTIGECGDLEFVRLSIVTITVVSIRPCRHRTGQQSGAE